MRLKLPILKSSEKSILGLWTQLKSSLPAFLFFLQHLPQALKIAASQVVLKAMCQYVFPTSPSYLPPSLDVRSQRLNMLACVCNKASR